MRIRQVSNGWIVEGEDTTVYSFDDEDTSRLEAFRYVLWEVVEQFGMVGSRHDAQRVRVVLEPGDKFVGADDV